MTNKLIDVHGYEDGMSPTGNPYNVPLSVANMLIYAGRASLSAGSAVSGSPEDGFAGFTGWTAIPSMTIYDGKLVMRLSWVGGTGAAPTAIYVGPNSLVAIPADAVDMVWRMYQGEDTTEEGVAGTPVVGKSGWSPVPTLVADGADRQVMHITWSGGTGTPPPDGFVGAGELVATAGLAVNLKGDPVPTLDLPGMTTAATAGTVAQKTAHRDALGLGPIATMTLPEAQSAVSGVGITDAQAVSGSLSGAVIGEVRTISSGVNAGTRVRWYLPSGYSAPCWCWDIYPQSQYKG